MENIKSKEQLIIPGLEEWRSEYSPKKIKRLENSWAYTYRKYILPNLPIYKIVRHYTKGTGRPSLELYAMMGAIVLQQMYDLTDEQTKEDMAFNQLWHFALDCYDEKNQVISSKSIWTMRKYCLEEEVAATVFSLVTDKLIKVLGIDTSKQRLDSVHVHSNMQSIGRIRIIFRAVTKFLKKLKKDYLDFYTLIMTDNLEDRYFKTGSDSIFGQVKPSETKKTLQILAEDAFALLTRFQLEDTITGLPSYKMLQRIFHEQCQVDNDIVSLKKPQDVPSDSVQNPSDPDAGYDGHKGKGYHDQFLETFKTEEERAEAEKSGIVKPDMITYVKTEPADIHDSHALEPAIQNVIERGLNCDKILADAAYGGTKNTEMAEGYGVTLTAPTLGRTSEKGHKEFAFDFVTYEITSCSAGKKPDKITYNKQDSITAIWYQSTCAGCKLIESCPTKSCTNGRKHYYTIDSIKCHFRREYEKSSEFKEEYRYRSGIEATNSRFISMTKARRSRYRGLEKMSFSQTLKALAVNMFRMSEFVAKLGFCVHKYVFLLIFGSYLCSKSEKIPNIA